jgi:hypothetical protein
LSLTGRLSAALLFAACLAVPAGAQSEGEDRDVRFEQSSDFPDTNDSGHQSSLETDMDALERAHRDYLRKSQLQLERPEADPIEFAPPPPPPNWLGSLLRFLGHLAPLLRLVFYAAIVLAIGGILYFIFGEALRIRFGRDRGKTKKAGDDIIADFRPEESVARSLLEEADALARAGKFAEAVHLLLFRSIEDIQTRAETGVPRSLTAREIGKLGVLPARARTALGPIIAIVERSFFGGRDVDESGWQTARASYQDFAFGGQWT